MNDRLNKLAEQAGFKLDDLPDDVLMPLEAFAESLVRECAKEVNHIRKQGGSTYGEIMLNKFKLKVE
jgi:hypothetical protein